MIRILGVRGWSFLTELIGSGLCPQWARHRDGSCIPVFNLDSPHELDMLHCFLPQAGLLSGDLKACISGELWITDRKALAGMHPSTRGPSAMLTPVDENQRRRRLTPAYTDHPG